MSSSELLKILIEAVAGGTLAIWTGWLHSEKRALERQIEAEIRAREKAIEDLKTWIRDDLVKRLDRLEAKLDKALER